MKEILIPNGYEGSFALLSKEEQGELIMAIFAYANRDEEITEEASPLVRLAFSFIEATIL